MKNAFSRMSYKCASIFGAAVLMGGAAVLTGSAALAGQLNEIKVTLPHPVTVGSATLPVGEYTIDSFEMGGQEFFIVRGEHTPAVTLLSERVDADADKTQVTLSKDGDQWHFDKLTIEGESQAFQLRSGK
jgi:hypothetical protein